MKIKKWQPVDLCTIAYVCMYVYLCLLLFPRNEFEFKAKHQNAHCTHFRTFKLESESLGLVKLTILCVIHIQCVSIDRSFIEKIKFFVIYSYLNNNSCLNKKKVDKDFFKLFSL